MTTLIVRGLRWLSRLDRSYFFALSALVSALAVSIALAFAPVVQAADGSDISLVNRDGAIVYILLLMPLFVLATPLISLPQNPAPIERSHRINSVAATFILFAFVGISLGSFGLFYGPSLIFSIASSSALFFGRKPRAAIQETKKGRLDADGIRISRGALRRQREQERLEAEGSQAAGSDHVQGETPLASSRRRRGRNRRKR